MWSYLAETKCFAKEMYQLVVVIVSMLKNRPSFICDGQNEDSIHWKGFHHASK